ncbi:hypothetical protein Tsubulata_007610, partial [Turnera subulata]
MNFRPDNDPLRFQPKTPHFFKITLGDTIHNEKLMIPPRFTRKYGKGLPSKVILNVPTGATWRVELERCGAEIWLQNGWKEFAEYYSLTYGHLLLFQYKGNHDFHVLIFDSSATEIEYPLGSDVHRDEQVFQDLEVEGSEADISIEIIVLFVFQRKDCFLAEAMRQVSLTTKVRNLQKQSARSMKPMSHVEKSRALSRASAFKSTNPFFKVVMQPSFVHGGYRMVVPSGFAKEHFPKRSGERLFSDRSDMPTNKNQKPSETESARCMQPMLGGVERAKALNRASASKSTNVTLKKKTSKPAASKTTRQPEPTLVHRGRKSSRGKQTGARSSQGKLNGKGKGIQEDSEPSGRQRVAEEINSIVLENPYFLQVLKDYHRHNMVLPRGFAKAAGLQKRKRIEIKDMEGRVWPVEICVKRKQSVQVYLTIGFDAFLKANKLVPGDTVVFHFMKTVGQ